jgi:branched-chain amino acid transport system substrate-binding protein
VNRRQRLPSRRGILAAAGAALLAVPARFAIGQTAKLKLGLMLPYTGTYAQLGEAITNGFKLAIAEAGDKLGRREVEFAVVDDESEPARAPENANKLVIRDKVDFLIGTVHSGVAMAMVKVARDTGTILIIPNAGADAATGTLCALNIFRTSFSNWQPAFPMGKVAADHGFKSAVTLTWQYAAGEESTNGFKEGFTADGGKILKELRVPFPNVEFQPLLTEIAALKPDVVYAFFAGGGAVKLVKDYAAAGLKAKIPLVGPGFLTDGTLPAQGEAALGLETTLHYGDALDIPKNAAFREAYKKAAGRDADVYAVQGYDTGQLLASGLSAVKGDTAARNELIASLEAAQIDSPRGRFSLSKAHNPIQNIYLRKVVGMENRVVGIAHKALADPARGCKMT